MKVKETSPAYLTRPKVFTYQDYLELPEDGNRYEVINGDLVMVPAPTTDHQDVSGNLEFELRKYIEKNQAGKMYHAPIDVVLSEKNVVQPDILFVSKENSKIITEKNIRGAPDLVIEILSPSTGYYDLTEKKDIYAEFGVKEYWIVDPKKQWVEIHKSDGSRFKLLHRLEKTGTLRSQVLKGFEIQITKFFEIN